MSTLIIFQSILLMLMILSFVGCLSYILYREKKHKQGRLHREFDGLIHGFAPYNNPFRGKPDDHKL